MNKAVDKIVNTEAGNMIIQMYEFECPRCKKVVRDSFCTHVSSTSGYSMCINCYNQMIDAQFKAWLDTEVTDGQ